MDWRELLIRFLFGPERDVALAIWQFVIPAAIGAWGILESKKQGDRANKLSERSTALAEEQAAIARKLFEEAEPLRGLARDRLMQLLLRGPRSLPDLSGLADRSNPFRRRFNVAQPTPSDVRPVLGRRIGP